MESFPKSSQGLQQSQRINNHMSYMPQLTSRISLDMSSARKLVMVGGNCGKTWLLNRFINDTDQRVYQEKDFPTTIRTTCSRKSILDQHGRQIELKVIDTCSDHIFMKMDSQIRNFTRDADCILYCIELDVPADTFQEQAEEDCKFLKSFLPASQKIVLVGTRRDLREQGEHVTA